jgi:MGT family glycosyltransferase
MARIICVALPAYGHLDLGGGLRMSHALKRMGHQVAWATGYLLRHSMENQGFAFYPVAPHTDVAKMCEQTRPMKGLERSQFIIDNFFLERDLLRSGVEELVQACNSFRPQVLCSEPYHYATALVAEILGLPWATFGSTGLPIHQPDSIQAQWDRGMVRLNQVRNEYGLRPVHTRTGNYSPYLCIRFSVPSFELCKDPLPPQSHFVGAPVPDRSGDKQRPRWLSVLPKDKPIVYATIGSVFRDKQLLETIVHAVGSMNVEAIVTTGANIDFDLREDSTGHSNVHIHQYLPHEMLFSHLSAVICHGGFSTSKDALSSGTPVLVIPLGSDNPENAQRVVNIGAGLCIDRESISAHSIQRALERLLYEPSFLEQARRMRDEFQRYGTAETAARLVLELAETGQAVLRAI